MIGPHFGPGRGRVHNKARPRNDPTPTGPRRRGSRSPISADDRASQNLTARGDRDPCDLSRLITLVLIHAIRSSSQRSVSFVYHRRLIFLCFPFFSYFLYRSRSRGIPMRVCFLFFLGAFGFRSPLEKMEIGINA